MIVLVWIAQAQRRLQTIEFDQTVLKPLLDNSNVTVIAFTVFRALELGWGSGLFYAKRVQEVMEARYDALCDASARVADSACSLASGLLSSASSALHSERDWCSSSSVDDQWYNTAGR